MFAWTDQVVADLRRFHAEGLSAGQIAVEIGAPTRNTVCGKLGRLGLDGKGRQIEVRPRTSPRQRATGRPLPRTTPFRMPKMNPGGDQRLNKLTAAPNVGPEIVDLPPDYGDAPVRLIDAGMDQCRWPLGDPGADMLVCGGATGGGSWCPRHSRIAYRPRAA